MGKTLIGVVASTKSDKTIVVVVSERKTHPLYRKQYSASTRFMAHDERNECEVGDKVSITETRPLSRRKRFTLEKILLKPTLREDDIRGVVEDVVEKPASKSKKKAEEPAA